MRAFTATGWRAVVMIIALAACRQAPPDDEQGPAPKGLVTAATVVGCYEFTDASGQPLGSVSGFWTAPVVFDTTPARSEPSYHPEPPGFALRSTAHARDGVASDAAEWHSVWRFLPPDTVRITRTKSDQLQWLQLTPRGRNFAGVGLGVRVPEVFRRLPLPPPRDSVFAARVACPHGAGQSSRPSA